MPNLMQDKPVAEKALTIISNIIDYAENYGRRFYISPTSLARETWERFHPQIAGEFDSLLQYLSDEGLAQIVTLRSRGADEQYLAITGRGIQSLPVQTIRISDGKGNRAVEIKRHLSTLDESL